MRTKRSTFYFQRRTAVAPADCQSVPPLREQTISCFVESIARWQRWRFPRPAVKRGERARERGSLSKTPPLPVPLPQLRWRRGRSDSGVLWLSNDFYKATVSLRYWDFGFAVLRSIGVDRWTLSVRRFRITPA
jgi:hypothetical protein